MTFSIVTFDKASGAAGVATITGGIAVGAFVPHCKAGVGAIATQGASTNWLYGEYGLNLLGHGQPCRDVLDQLLDADAGRDYRQCAIIDRYSNTAAWTGPLCREHFEYCQGDAAIAAGNWLAQPEITKSMIDAYEKHTKLPLANRLLAALKAGADHGGDSRGQISGALRIDFLDKPPIDLRVDSAPDRVLIELDALLDQYCNGDFKAFYESVPTRKEFGKFKR